MDDDKWLEHQFEGHRDMMERDFDDYIDDKYGRAYKIMRVLEEMEKNKTCQQFFQDEREEWRRG